MEDILCILQQVSEQVSRKCPLRTRRYSFQPLHRSRATELPTLNFPHLYVWNSHSQQQLSTLMMAIVDNGDQSVAMLYAEQCIRVR